MSAREASQEITAATGATVADARSLARKSPVIAVFYRSGPGDYDQHCLFLDPPVFLASIATKPADQAMPSRVGDNGILMIGVLP